MHAIRQYEFGPAESLVYEEVPDLTPGDGQVRIAVEASGVHLLDTTIRAGVPGGPFPLPDLPMTPGREVAGTVDAVGPGVEGRWLGRRVVAHLGRASGGYAEAAVAAATSLHEVPGTVRAEQAVAMIGTGRTALLVLDAARLGPDDVVLVTSAAGGLGSLFVQAGRRAGATVVGVAGGESKAVAVRDHGAHVAVDYRQPGWADAVRAELGDRHVTVALDGVGGEVGRTALELIGPGGRLVLFGWSSGEATKLDAMDLYRNALTVTVPLGPAATKGPGGLRWLEERSLAALAAGELVPVVNPPFRLADAAAAHTALTERRTMGKVVLVP
ncbi:MAG TPA: zinc-binding dehydrogenase [Jiangellaceae bacterium]